MSTSRLRVARSKIRLCALGTAATGALLLSSGCGGSGGTAATTPSPTPTSSSTPTPTPTPSAGSTVVRSEVRVLPTDGTVTIGAVTDSSVTLSGSGVPALAPGAVIVSGAGEGLLRKVVSSATSGGQTVVQTTQATLEDVFQQADIKITNHPFALSDFTTQDLAPGVTLTPGDDTPLAESRSQSKGRSVSNSFTATIPVIDLAAGGGQVTVEGTVGVTLTLDADIQIKDNVVQTVLFKPTIVGNVKLIGKSTYKTSFSKSLTYANLTAAPISFLVGPVPVVFTPHFSLSINADGTADVGLILTSRAHVVATTGAVYAKDTGWATTLDWSKDGSFLVGKNIYATVDGNLTPAHVELGLDLYGVATGSLKADYPTINFHLAHESTPPAGLRFTETANYHAYAGYNVSVLGHSLTSYNSGDFIHGSDKWVDQFYPDNGGVNVGVQ